MGLENWGEWAAVVTGLFVGFGLLYAKVSSIVTRIDGIKTEIKGVLTRMKEDREERLRIWERLDEQGKEITRMTAELEARK